MLPVSIINTITLHSKRTIPLKKGNITCNPGSQEAETGGLLGVGALSSLHSDHQASQGYILMPNLK